jgi:hypothetical protein
MTAFTLGSTIRIRVQFLDADNAPVNPLYGAQASIRYPTGARRTTDTVDLEDDGDGYWSVEWDSRESTVGTVYVHARTKGVAPISAKDFSFDLVANISNPDNE